MEYDSKLITSKLLRWERFFKKYQLPTWSELPNIGLYMDQVISLLSDYLNYLPPEIKEDQLVTPNAINNYVRMKAMPEPKKKKYYRIHLAYLIMICTLKQSLSLTLLRRLLPTEPSEEEAERAYTLFLGRHRAASSYFMKEAKRSAATLLGLGDESEVTADTTEEFILTAAVISGLSKLITEKLLLLDGRKAEEFSDEFPISSV